LILYLGFFLLSRRLPTHGKFNIFLCLLRSRESERRAFHIEGKVGAERSDEVVPPV